MTFIWDGLLLGMDLPSPHQGDLDIFEHSGASQVFMSSLWAEAGTELIGRS